MQQALAVDANIKESAKNVLFELQDDMNITCFVQVFCLTRWDKDVLCFAVCFWNSSSGIENEFFCTYFQGLINKTVSLSVFKFTGGKTETVEMVILSTQFLMLSNILYFVKLKFVRLINVKRL